MTDITQKSIESEGLTEVKDGETFDIVRLSLSRQIVSVHSHGVGIDTHPLRSGDGPWFITFNGLSTAMDCDDDSTYFGDDIFEQHYQPPENFSNKTLLFTNPTTALSSNLTHVHVTGGSYTGADN